MAAPSSRLLTACCAYLLVESVRRRSQQEEDLPKESQSFTRVPLFIICALTYTISTGALLMKKLISYNGEESRARMLPC